MYGNRAAVALGLLGLALALACRDAAVLEEDPRAKLETLERPNVVLVMVDTLRPDWTTPYDSSAATSPELARWAGQGVVFERVLAQSSWTKVSVASLMTSLWPPDHGVREVRDALGEGAETLAELFQGAGYRTYGVQSNGWLAATFGFHQGFDRYVFPRGAKVAWMKSMVWPHADNVYLEADRLLEAHDRELPFFLYLHFMDVHEYAAPSDFKHFGTDAKGDYLAAIRWVDHVLERLRVRLDELGLLDDTVLVLSSDHGETFGEDRHHGHARNVRTPVLRVPLILRFPFPAEPQRISQQVRNLDLAPTLLELAGIPIPDSFEGRSLLPLLAEDAPLDDLPSYASLGALLYVDAVLQESVNDGGWSFSRDLGEAARERLFDGRVDPDENVDLLDVEVQDAERLRAMLDAYQRRSPRPDTVRSEIRIDPGIAEKLRALGYLQ